MAWYFEEADGTMQRVIWYFEEGGVTLKMVYVDKFFNIKFVCWFFVSSYFQVIFLQKHVQVPVM